MNDSNLVNTKLGKYEILAELGRGGMGVVYRGYDPPLKRQVAIKVLAPHLVWESAFVERFVREARSAARLSHPNIVTIHDVGQEAGWYYFVMEYVEGQTLTDYIAQRGRLSARDALAILTPLARALDHAHHNGLVHRDIKPANIIITSDGQVKLTDFGIARAGHETRLTATGAVIGTPEYMSPEQAKGLEIGARTDQYSLAVVAYEMLCAQVPFQANSTLALLYKITHEPPPPINRIQPDLPQAVEQVLNKALAKNPDDRYPSVSAFVDDLGRALAGQPVHLTAQTHVPASTATPQVMATGTAPPQTRAPARRRVPAWGWALGALAIVALVAGGLLFASSSSTAKPSSAPKSTAVAIATATLTHTPPPSKTPDVKSTDAAGTAVAAAKTASASAPTITASATPTPTATETPTNTATSSPTHTPQRTPTATLTRSPSSTPGSTATATPTATSKPSVPTPNPTKPAATASAPTATSPPTTSGVLITFEQMGAWRRGDQPYGELTQTGEQVRSGNYAAELSYDFPVTDEDFVVFVRQIDLAGQPETVGAWVIGDGSGHYLNVWIQDAQGEIWSVHLGQVGGSGWRQMVGKLDPSLDWPSGHVSGPDNGAIDYPIRFNALVLDRPGSGPQKGTFYIDDISVWQDQQSAGVTPTPAAAAPAPTPAAAAPPPTTAVAGPPPGETGHIVFTVKVGEAYYLYSTDPAWSQMQEIGLTDWNHSTCAGGGSASTVDGYTVNLYGVNKCNVTDRVDVCLSPDGQYKAVTDRVGEAGHTVALWRASDNEILEGYYQGPLNKAAGIVWAPDSSRFLFTIGRSVHTAQVGSAGYLQIIPEIDDTWPPQYMPDGSFIYYLKPVGSEGASDILVVSPDGSTMRNITNAPAAYKMCPRWRP
jgi:serine/threonine-protein kinase